MRVPWIHVPALPAAGEVTLPQSAAHHLRSVLRLSVDAPLILFDGRGRAVHARLASLDRREANALLGEPHGLQRSTGLRLVLGVAPLKGDGLAWVVEKATELGVAAVQLVETCRTDTNARTALTPHRLERLQRIAVAAAEQSERAVVPRVDPPIPFSSVLQTKVKGPRVICVERTERPWPSPAGQPPEALVLVGPHGGWTDDETAAAEASGFVTASLGPRVLRAETAALVALTLAQATWGDGPALAC